MNDSACSRTLRCIISNVTEAGLVPECARAGEKPATFAGRLATMLAARFRAAEDRRLAVDIAVLPCELVDRNGEMLRGLVERAASTLGFPRGFDRWLESNVVFANTLVDRIVTEPGDHRTRQEIESRLGHADPLLAVCEPHRLWAIERPGSRSAAFDEIETWLARDPQTEIVDDLRPVARRKVRLLNGTHTAAAPVALLAGCSSVREAMAHPDVGPFIATLPREIVRVFVPTDADAGFAASLPERLANPHLDHRWADIANGSFGKCRVRVLPTLAEAEARRASCPALELGVAALLAATRRVNGRSHIGVAPEAGRQTADAFDEIWAHPRAAAADAVRFAFSERGPLHTDLPLHRDTVNRIGAHLDVVVQHGVQAAIRAAITRIV